MKRLSTQLLAAMLLIAVVSLVVVPLAQNFALKQTLNRLEPDFRERVTQETDPSTFRRRRGGAVRRGAGHRACPDARGEPPVHVTG